MSSSKSSRKRTGKGSSDSAAISFDLLSNLTYMAALATGSPSRDLILERAITQDFKTCVYFRRVYLLAKRMGFDYVRAFRLVANKVGADTVKNHLLRFAGAITAGVSEADFLAQEARVEREQYISGYHRSLETLAKWGDAYAALLVSMSLVVVVSMISTMLSDMGRSFVVLMTLSVCFVSAFGVYIIFRTAPTETLNYRNRQGPKALRWAKRSFFMLVPASVLIGVFLAFNYGFPWFLIAVGLAFAPPGLLAWLDSARVNKVDQEVAPFIRSLGNVTAALGTTLSGSLAKIDRRSLGTLEPYIRRLQVRLNSKISPEKSWDAFRDEVGSQLMNRTTRMFVDGVALGGPPDRVGAIASEYAMDSAMMRARRVVSAAPFAFLTIPLHFAMTGLMVFVLEIMKAFNVRIGLAVLDLESNSGGAGIGAAATLPVFQQQDLGLLSNMTTVALMSMTIGNALTPKFALGGHPLNTALFGAITFLMTAFNMLIIPTIAGGVLLPE
ncbi:MAG: hypothetical protein J4N78_09085 [Chloroflexi bacterium]|nr:hypothetical protein [Chloroflexota bacterium]